jgi:hypothetical protein
MSATTQKACAWSGIGFMVLFLLGFWVIAGFVPPPSPHWDAQRIAAFFADDTDRIRLGLLINTTASALIVPWVVAITTQLRRIEGRRTPLADVQLILGGLLAIEFIIPLIVWQAAAFRPLDSPVVTQRLNDLGWLLFIGVVCTAVLQAVAIGVAILQDARERPVFPRWAGYFNIWIGLLFTPGGLCVFFKHGPFAWNGLFSLYLPLAAFTVWMVAMTALVLAAVGRPEPAVAGD